MTHRLLSHSLVAAALAIAFSYTTEAQVSRPPEGAASKPTPKLADGRPDLNGTWDHVGGIDFVRPKKGADGSVCFFGCDPAPAGARGGGRGARGGGAPPAAPPANAAAAPGAPPPGPFPKYKSEFLAKVKDLNEHQVQRDTVLQCQPPGVPRIGPPAKIMQNGREVVFLYDDVNGSFFRIIPIDGRPHRKGLPASYLGDAVGRFEGDTLVIETVNFNEETWLTDNGAFHTKDLKVVERLRRVGDTIQYTAVAQDPAVLVEPFTMAPQTMWITTNELEESARCEDRDLEHIVDGSHHDNPR